MILNVGETLVVESSIASLISVGFGAINDLLFGKVNFLILEKSPRLKNSNSRECPA